MSAAAILASLSQIRLGNLNAKFRQRLADVERAKVAAVNAGLFDVAAVLMRREFIIHRQARRFRALCSSAGRTPTRARTAAQRRAS